MDYAVLMELVARIGVRLASSGAETYRVEESITRILSAYGQEGRVYCVPNSLFITIAIPNQLPFTQLCRMPKQGNDIDAVECYNNLSRRICSEVPDLDVAMEWVKETESQRKHYSVPMNLLGHVLVHPDSAISSAAVIQTVSAPPHVACSWELCLTFCPNWNPIISSSRLLLLF